MASGDWTAISGHQNPKQSFIVSGQGMYGKYQKTFEIDLESFPLGACKDGELRTGDKANAIAHANWNVDTFFRNWKLRGFSRALLVLNTSYTILSLTPPRHSLRNLRCMGKVSEEGFSRPGIR